jgi:hemerythrin
VVDLGQGEAGPASTDRGHRDDNSAVGSLDYRQSNRHGSYPFAVHKTDHERLLDEIRDIMDNVEDDQDIDDEALGARLETWFARHFETHDARLHRQLGD